MNFFILTKKNSDRANSPERRPPSRMNTPVIMKRNDRLSRRSYRVTTSLNNSIEDDSKPITPILRGKTPLI